MIDPRISLGLNNLDIGQRFNRTVNTLRNQDLLANQRELAPLTLAQAQRTNELQQAQQPALINAANLASSDTGQFIAENQQQNSLAVQLAQSLKPLLDAGDVQGTKAQLLKIRDGLIQHKLPTNDIDADLQQIDTPDGFKQLQQEVTGLLTPASQQIGMVKKQFGTSSTVKDEKGNLFLSTQQRDPLTGEVKTVFSPVSGDSNLTPVGRVSFVNDKGLTPEEELAQTLKKTEQTKKIESKIKRSREIKKDIGDNSRRAAFSAVKLSEAINLLKNEDTSQGISAGLKLGLSKIFPGIDVSNEGQLESLFNQLALNELQSFKGPTTDFEFNIAKSIPGNVTDSKTANLARLKAIQRANWFLKRKFKQFKEFEDKKQDPDDFEFNFKEKIKTKKGEFTLEQLQATAVKNNLSIEEVLDKLNE